MIRIKQNLSLKICFDLNWKCNCNNNYKCNCSFVPSETPHVILTWDQEGTDLDLHVVDPNGYDINCACQLMTRSIVSQGFVTTSSIETTDHW